MKVKIPWLIKKIYPTRIWEGPKEDKNIYLTFDDGPIPEVTPWVLEMLRKFEAKATFFCIGDNVRKHPEIFRQVVAEGHAVGNHTFNHLNGWKTGTEEYLSNTEKGREIMQQHLEKPEKIRLFRPPYGKIRNRQARALEEQGYQVVMWDVLSLDYDRKLSGKECYQNVIKYAKAGSIIVFHDSLKAEKNLKFALPKVLEAYRWKGYSFEALPLKKAIFGDKD